MWLHYSTRFHNVNEIVDLEVTTISIFRFTREWTLDVGFFCFVSFFVSFFFFFFGGGVETVNKFIHASGELICGLIHDNLE